MWRHRAKCAILEKHESDKIFLTVRLQSQILFEGIVNKVLPSPLSVLENKGGYCSPMVFIDALKELRVM